MKKSVILELCRQKVIDELEYKEYSNNKNEGFGFLEGIEVVGFKEYDNFCRVIFIVSSADILIESIYYGKNGKIKNKIYVEAGDIE